MLVVASFGLWLQALPPDRQVVRNGLVWIDSVLYSSSISLSAAWSGDLHAAVGSGGLNTMSRSIAIR
jgi:hypothetical protein